ncbi:MAG: chaperone protein DnaJ [Caulobacter sp.]|nr:chaperone protein DnaJ [Caulobacter sp.]
MSLYDDLGLDPSAPADRIKAAHRRAVKAHHPDAGGDRERFDRAQKAYDILSDPERRSRYDETGEVDEAPVSSEKQAVLTLAREVLMGVVMGVEDLSKLDVVGRGIETLERGLLHLAARTADVDVKLARLAAARARLSRLPVAAGEEDDGDLVGQLFDQQARDLQGAKPQIERNTRVHQGAIELLRRYAYRVDYADGTATISRGQGTLNVVVEERKLDF